MEVQTTRRRMWYWIRQDGSTQCSPIDPTTVLRQIDKEFTDKFPQHVIDEALKQAINERRIGRLMRSRFDEELNAAKEERTQDAYGE